jgi:DNA-directed RNA polymerase subunit RPC12/RpoP
MMGVSPTEKERHLASPKDDKGTVDPSAPRIEPPPRPECPRCGSGHTQPFTHGGPASRVNMKCIDCGQLFKDPVRTA